jgi:putative redox protein
MDEAGLGVEQYWAGLQSGLGPGEVLVTDSGQMPWGQVLLTPDHILYADEPVELDGRNSGPSATTLALLALGACTAMTLRMYAVRKGWSIARIAVRISFGMTETGTPDRKRITRKIEIEGPLDDEQRARLFAIAEKCPVHRMLTEGVVIQSEFGAAM